MERKISVRDIRQSILESKNEFKPKFGDGVESENKKNNEKTRYSFMLFKIYLLSLLNLSFEHFDYYS